jgi:rhodanese-related sulfurtransferase
VKTLEIQRTPRRDDAFFIPRPVAGSDGQFVVDATWGHINPFQIADGVRTVGELEVISHIESGLPLVDTRLARHFTAGTIPTATNIPHPETLARLDDFDPSVETVLFCNGPQCAATPDAIQLLLAAGYPRSALIYYRGGVHDWVTLGLPLVEESSRRLRAVSPAQRPMSPARARERQRLAFLAADR